VTEWQPIETVPPSDITNGWPIGVRVLLYSKTTGIRSGDIYNWAGRVRASITNLHGDAIENWGVTHWMPLPEPPK